MPGGAVATSIARKNSQKQIPVIEAKARVLELIAQGAKVAEACQAVGRSPETYKDWRKNDPAFRAQLEDLRLARADIRESGKPEVPDFDVFCRDYLHEPLFPHQLNMWDALEGRRPRFLDPAMTYEPGDPGRIIINIPPNHAKTTTFSINYVTWLIHKDPGISVAIISKSQGYAKKILNGIKARLTSSAYRAMHMKFAPDGGWRDPDQSWTQTMIYVQGKFDSDETEKDPTVEAVGLGGQIYGGRFRVILLDDVVDNENAHRHEDQVDWVMTILDSRLPPDGGLMAVLGTRLAPTELYSELRKKTDEDDAQFFSYFAQPAVLEYAEKREDWRTLWPWQLGSKESPGAELRCMSCYKPASESDCCDTRNVQWLRPRWTGQRLAKKRFPLGERRWSMVWQQMGIPEDATFNQRTVTTSINRARQPGLMRAEAMGHRVGGMQGLYVVLGVDPATVGNTAMIVGGLDRTTEKRWVLDGVNVAGMSPASMRSTIKRLCDLHGVQEAVIERNAFQKFLTDDPDLVKYFQSRGIKRTPHYTTANKVDPDFGVMSMAPLFESTGRAPNNNGGGIWKRVTEGDLIELPDDRQSAWVSSLVSQLIAWEPSEMAQGQKQDLVMALWFCEIAFKRILSRTRQMPTHLPNPFAGKARLRERQVINLAAYREQLRAEREAV